MRRIVCDQWSSLADYTYKKNNNEAPKENCIVFVYMDDIAEFFHECKNLPYKYIVISALSDYGLCYQKDHPVYKDMQKWLKFITVSDDHDYNALNIPPRCNISHCKINDTFSVRMHTWTKDTFDEIPDNIIEWYCTNNLTEDHRIIRIPFGIPQYSDDIIDEYYTYNSLKIEKMYVNFQANTVLRGEIKQVLSTIDWCVCPSTTMPIKQFLQEMKKCKYVIAPCGNGYDCYRTLEAIYIGTIPVLETGVWNEAYEGLPFISLDSYNELGLDTFDLKRQQITHLLKKDLTDTRADMDYWEQRINLAKGKL